MPYTHHFVAVILFAPLQFFFIEICSPPYFSKPTVLRESLYYFAALYNDLFFFFIHLVSSILINWLPYFDY